MKTYARILLYAYPLLKTVEKDYEEHIRNRALLSYASKKSAEELAEYLAGEVVEMRRLEWLKGRMEEALSKLSEEERALLSLKYFRKRKRAGEPALEKYTERTYYRRQKKLGEKVVSLLRKEGLSEETYVEEYADMALFKRVAKYVEREDSKRGKGV